jgi:4-amino-4-deoxy-L-arabinose transferase-like glycosyltransferase
MLIIFLLIACITLFLIFTKNNLGWRRSLLLTFVSVGTLIALSTEGLSLMRGLTLQGLLIFWVIVDGLLFVIFRQQGKRKVAPALAPESWQQWSPFYQGLLISLIVIGIAIGLTALISPPNNFDSMTYHLGRMVHWIQNQTVAHYPTHIQRQLYSGSWPGFALTQLYLLSGGDQLLNLVQWGSMVGSVVGTSLIAEELGGDRRAQLFTAVVCATIPVGILQAASTQTDYVTAFWLVCFTYFGFVTLHHRMAWTYVPAIGASLGLALLTKTTAYVYAFPFGLWLVFSGIRQLRLKVWQPMVIAGAIALSLNLGQFQRNYSLFGSLFGPTGQNNKIFSIPILISNVLRNLAVHLSTPVRPINLAIIKVIAAIHAVLGVDASDPRTTNPPGQKFDLQSLINHEDLAGNLVHLLLFFICVLSFILYRRRLQQRTQLLWTLYLLTIVAGFILFCVTVIWSPWRSRLHLSLFVLAAPFMGLVLADLFRRRIAHITLVSLLVLSLIWVLCNESRPLLANKQFLEERRWENIVMMPRIEQYFMSADQRLKGRRTMQKDVVGAMAVVEKKACSAVGLVVGGNTWEYPYWMLGQRMNPPVRLEHVLVNNVSARQGTASYKAFQPCALLVVPGQEGDRPSLTVNDVPFQKEWEGRKISVFVRRSPA